MPPANASRLNQSAVGRVAGGREIVMPRTRTRATPCDAALHNNNMTRCLASEDAMSPKKSQDLMVSATGTWRVMPEADSPKRARATLPMALGVRCNATISSVLSAINLAARDNQTSVLSLPHRTGHENEVLKVRPARETGFAIVSVEKFDGDPALPDLRLLMNLFSLTETEAEIGISLLVTNELREIAEARHCALETVRMHVKSLLRKTGMPSQKRLTVLFTTLAMLAQPQGRGQA
jgi:DNA-binding CsgD family transcriptional regulator